MDIGSGVLGRHALSTVHVSVASERRLLLPGAKDRRTLKLHM